MDWSLWQPTYEAILADFGWNSADDAVSAQRLAGMVPPGTWHHVGTELKHRKRAVVVGCGPALDDLQARDLGQGVVVAADGATARLREISVLPRVVVTDLDGDEEALRWAAEQGSSIVVHAHGHNERRLGLARSLGPLVAGSCQGDPSGLAPLRNHGGFTDGDRAVLLCEHYGVGEVALAAFDFEARPSRHSGTWDPATKPRKLRWAQRIVEGAVARGVKVSSISLDA